MPFLALDADWAEVESFARQRMDLVLAGQSYVLGSQTGELERSIAKLTGAEFAVACSSGSDGLYLALKALGLGPGDAVLVPAFTFVATAAAVVRAGATPVFVDMDAATFISDASQFCRSMEEEFEGPPGARRHRPSGSRLRALVAVHLYGRFADMDALLKLAAREGISLVEDAAQALSARGSGGFAGAMGDLGVISFYPTKNLGGAGDGGMVLTSDAGHAERLRLLRVHGMDAGGRVILEGAINARMGELQAAVLNAKLARLGAWTAARCRVAGHYAQALGPVAEGGRISLPQPGEAGAHVWHQYVIRVPDIRDRVREGMKAEGVETALFYPRGLHRQPCFAAYASRPLPECDLAAAEVLSLPMRPSLSVQEVEAVAGALARALEV